MPPKKSPKRARKTPARKRTGPASSRTPVSSIIGLGIDVIEVDRIQSMIDKHAARFLARVFTPTEVFHSAGRRNRAQHLAARFAAKEAAMKALGTGLTSGVTWHDFEVITDAAGKPSLAVTGIAQNLAKRMRIRSWQVSLTHTRLHAAAVVVATA